MKNHLVILVLLFVTRFVVAQQVEPPMPPWPIATFRSWLDQSPEERKVALAKRSEQNRRVIEQKLKEYSALSPADRKRRLDATELQWYVANLLKMPKAKRDPAILQVPPPLQPMVM